MYRYFFHVLPVIVYWFRVCQKTCFVTKVHGWTFGPKKANHCQKMPVFYTEIHSPCCLYFLCYKTSWLWITMASDYSYFLLWTWNKFWHASQTNSLVQLSEGLNNISCILSPILQPVNFFGLAQFDLTAPMLIHYAILAQLILRWTWFPFCMHQ